MQETLHEVIDSVLKKAGEPLKVSQIAKIIKDQQLWFTPSKGKSPKQEQISARVNNYSHLFKRENGFVELIANKKDKRLLRVTYNEHLWEVPSGHKWNKENWNKNNIAYENKHGYGAEEWLFNSRYNIDGIQYGYIRGLWEVLDTDKIDTAYLFCIHPVSKDRLFVAVLNEVELLDPNTLPAKVKKTFDRYAGDMKEELKMVDADYHNANVADMYPILRFRIANAVIFDQPVLINELKEGRKYNRFKPYKVNADIENFLLQVARAKQSVFTPGKRKITQGGYSRTIEPRTQKIAGLHNEITEELERYLSPDFTLKKKNISIEKMMFGNNIADFVLKLPDSKLIIMEIKTSSNARYNIREALGQLLDYSHWDRNLEIVELVIISPSALNDELKGYLFRTKKSLKIKLSYWHYRKDDKADRFFKY